MAPKKVGGLGVGDAVLRNTALLFKWWWRFSKEECSLWKKVVCSYNSMNPFEMVHGQPVPPRGGPWKDICQLQIREPQVRETMIRGLSMEVGNGRTTRFWKNVWLPDGVLKDLFPRLFSDSNLKGFVVGDCGFWDGLEWIWSFQWSRQLFRWELELLNHLHEILHSVKLTTEREDKVVCKFDRTGIFSTNSFVKGLQEAVLSEKITSYNFTSVIWRGFVPQMVELFSWFVFIERMNTKERLSRLGVIGQLDNMCALCCKVVESAVHLFLGCELTWQVWCAWLFAFGRSWAILGTLKQHFESWTHASQRKIERKRWLIEFFAVIWAIWLERNDRVFNNHGS
ncbi:uncharacterized protein LOC107485018 [Arachis duranensis]|uniref:Uncharacterized protein LOC107485018 n=1 Tax=Arachis duranensis TaxID=130453 RepID=A0A6P4D2L1_ARADU|nr:uncharacterized protein LOC107485018 [Arachis duranensis]